MSYALGSVVYNGAESVIQAINGAKYGDHFVFAGKDGLNVPYSWSDDGKTLYYRGVNVDAGGVPVPKAEEIPAFTQGLQDELDNVLKYLAPLIAWMTDSAPLYTTLPRA